MGVGKTNSSSGMRVNGVENTYTVYTGNTISPGDFVQKIPVPIQYQENVYGDNVPRSYAKAQRVTDDLILTAEKAIVGSDHAQAIVRLLKLQGSQVTVLDSYPIDIATLYLYNSRIIGFAKLNGAEDTFLLVIQTITMLVGKVIRVNTSANLIEGLGFNPNICSFSEYNSRVSIYPIGTRSVIIHIEESDGSTEGYPPNYAQVVTVSEDLNTITSGTKVSVGENTWFESCPFASNKVLLLNDGSCKELTVSGTTVSVASKSAPTGTIYSHRAVDRFRIVYIPSKSSGGMHYFVQFGIKNANTVVAHILSYNGNQVTGGTNYTIGSVGKTKDSSIGGYVHPYSACINSKDEVYAFVTTNISNKTYTVYKVLLESISSLAISEQNSVTHSNVSGGHIFSECVNDAMSIGLPTSENYANDGTSGTQDAFVVPSAYNVMAYQDKIDGVSKTYGEQGQAVVIYEPES